VSVSVVIADDSSDFRVALRELVRAATGFEVVGDAESADDAVRLAERLRPDLVLMDVRMGAADGVDAAARISALGVGSLVVLLTAGEVDSIQARARAAGATVVVDKHALRLGMLERIWAEHGATARS
jgi:DNA-binding NarL/FixJ family response regulator